MSEPVLWPREGRRQPTMIGRDAAGRPLPGGPYTSYQLIALVTVIALGWNTRGWWGSDMSVISHVVFILAAAVVAAYFAGQIDFLQYNPLVAFAGISRSLVNLILHPLGGGTSTAAKQRTIRSATTVPGRALQLLELPDECEPAAEELGVDDAPASHDIEDDGQQDATEPHAPRKRRLKSLRGPSRPRRVTREGPGPEEPTTQPHPTPERQSSLERFLAAAEKSHP